MSGGWMSRRTAGAAGCALAVVVTAACGSGGGSGGAAAGGGAGGGGSSSGASGVFQISGVLPLTGTFGPVGVTLLAGMNAEAELLNKQGGILGRPIKITIKDSASQTQQAVSAMRSVLSDPAGVDAVVAEATTSLNAAVMPIVAPAKIISVTSASGQPTLYPTDFSFGSTPQDESGAELEAIKSLGLTRVGIIGTDDDTGQADARTLAAQAPKYGLTVVSTELFDPAGSDYTAQLQKLRSAGAQALAGNLKGAPIGVFANGLSDLGWSGVKAVGDVGWGSSPLATLVPKNVQPQVTFVGALGSTRVGGKLSAQQQQFIAAIKATNGTLDSLTASAVGADMVTALKYAFDKAGSLNQAAAVKAMDGMKDDPSAAKLTWQFFLGQSPRFSATVHDSSNINPAAMFALNQIGDPVYGTYTGKAIS
jgi:branched-chain amino acid transport system substrate-binding protein